MKNRRFIFSVIALAVFTFLIFPISPQAQTSNVTFKTSKLTPRNTAALEQEVFRLVNQTREEKGLKKLAWSNEVAAIARQHSANMANYNFFSHIGIDGKKVDDRADSIGLSRWQSIGENIAYNSGFDDPVGRAVLGWMNSAGHRQNILRDTWKETGIGIAVTAQGKVFITQVFLKRK
jgi:uncharacterized protein YkwD